MFFNCRCWHTAYTAHLFALNAAIFFLDTNAIPLLSSAPGFHTAASPLRGERERENEQSNGQQRRSDYTDVSKLSKGKQRMKGTKWAKGPAKVSNWITELSLQGDVGLLRLLFQWSHDAKWFLTQSFQYDLNMSSIGCPLAQCLSFHVNVVVKLQHPLNSRRKFHEDLLYVAVWRCLAVFGFVCFCPEKMNALFEYV